jgi:DNA modification methylase
MLRVNTVIQGDAMEVLRTFPSDCVDMAITSPPYWALRDYEVRGQIGVESSFGLYVNRLCDVFDEVRRVLKPEGTCWLNLGDTYSGSSCGRGDTRERTGIGIRPAECYRGQKAGRTELADKCLLQLPARVAIGMCSRGWILRNEIVWHKPNSMPSSARDRFTVDFEKLFFFVKSRRYYFRRQFEPFAPNSDVVYRARLRRGKGYHSKAPYRANLPASFDPRGRNRRCVWTIRTRPCHEAHSAIFPQELIETPILAGCPERGIVLDPFLGSGTTAITALDLGRKFVGIELNPAFVEIANRRIASHRGCARAAA